MHDSYVKESIEEMKMVGYRFSSENWNSWDRNFTANKYAVLITQQMM